MNNKDDKKSVWAMLLEHSTLLGIAAVISAIGGIIAILLLRCNQIPPTATPTWTPTITVAPTAPPTPTFTPTATLTPTQPATPHPTVTPTSPRGASDAAVNAARLRLTQGGLLDPDLVSVISITPTVFPDDCLGLPSDLICHSKATPGYIIELERDQERYIFHVDQDGEQARLAWSSIEPLRDAFIEWQYNDGQECKVALIGTDQIRYGMCGEAMLAASSRASMWDNINGQSQANYLKQTYAPFTANTVRGTLVFQGTGTVVANQAEQRAIAEWAVNRFAEANSGHLLVDAGLILFWLEESPSLCGWLWVYQTGLAVAWNCPGTEALGVGFLTATQMEQFYT